MEINDSTCMPCYPLVEPRYMLAAHTADLPHHQSASGSAYSNHLQFLGYILWNPVTILNGIDVYQYIQPIYTNPMLPHQQSIPPITYQQLLPQQLTTLNPLVYSYWDPFENLTQYQNSFSVAETNQQQFEDVDLNVQFHMEDDVMVPHSMDELSGQHDRKARARSIKKEATIESNIHTQVYISSTNQSTDAPSDHDMCIVCQSEYENSEKIGTLKCGHRYHFDCIKKWLKKKNLCPICKATAFPWRDRRKN